MSEKKETMKKTKKKVAQQIVMQIRGSPSFPPLLSYSHSLYLSFPRSLPTAAACLQTAKWIAKLRGYALHPCGNKKIINESQERDWGTHEYRGKSGKKERETMDEVRSTISKLD